MWELLGKPRKKDQELLREKIKVIKFLCTVFSVLKIQGTPQFSHEIKLDQMNLDLFPREKAIYVQDYKMVTQDHKIAQMDKKT